MDQSVIHMNEVAGTERSDDATNTLICIVISIIVGTLKDNGKTVFSLE